MSKDDDLAGKSKCLLFASLPHPTVKTPSCTACQESRALSPPSSGLVGVLLENNYDCV